MELLPLLLHPVISMTAPGDSLELQQNQSVPSVPSLSLSCWLIFRSLSLQLPVRKPEASVPLEKISHGALHLEPEEKLFAPDDLPAWFRSNKSKWVHVELEFTREADIHEAVLHPPSDRRSRLGSSPSPNYSISSYQFNQTSVLFGTCVFSQSLPRTIF